MTLQVGPRLQNGTPRDPQNPPKIVLETIIRAHRAADTPQMQPQKLKIIKINPKIMKISYKSTPKAYTYHKNEPPTKYHATTSLEPLKGPAAGAKP